MISSILAISDNNAIGYKNSLPWTRIPEDMLWFRKNTEHHIVVMGRKTWESIGSTPLRFRTNIIVSAGLYVKDGVKIISHNAVDEIQALSKSTDDKIFIMGGLQLFNATWGIVDKIYITRIRNTYTADIFLDIDPILSGMHLEYSEHLDASNTRPALDFQIWKRN
jgi:dihydrofolate reductase